MKNKKKFFDKNLYLEGIRQLKIIGILGIVINMIFAVGVPLGNYLSAKSDYRSYVNNNITEQFTKYAINAVECHIYYLLFFLIFTPLMVFALFKFLNRRENCDFYHSLPHTRQCLFLSFSAAIVTWLAAQIFLTTAVSAIFYQIFSGYLILQFSRLFCFAVNVFVISLLIACALLLACSLSGNTITSMIVFLILFFTPRIFIVIYQALMSSELDYLTGSMNPLLSARNNLFYNIFQSLGSNSSTYKEITSIGFPIVYTLFMVVILFAGAYFSFVKRRSEAAESSMNHKLLQTIFRTIFTMLLCMIPISILFSYYVQRNTILYKNHYNNVSMTVFLVVISYIAVILGMFLYELLTTKNAKNALRSLKSIPVIAVLNIAVFLLLTVSFGHYKNLRLDEKEIDSVNLISLGHFYQNDYYDQSSYFEAMTAKYDFTEQELISLLCTAFNNYADLYNDYLDGKREYIYNYNSNAYSGTYSLAVQFHGKSDYTFHLQLDTQTTDKFYKLLYSNKEFYSIYMKLPELTEKDTIYFSNASDVGISEEFTKELYESLRAELAGGEIYPKNWIENIDYSAIGRITVEKYMDSTYYNFGLPINFASPKTYKKLLDYYVETRSEDLEKFLDSLRDFEEVLLDTAHETSDKRTYYNITSHDSVNNDSYSITFSTLDETTKEYQSDNSYIKKAVTLLREHAKPVSEIIPEEDLLMYITREELNYNETDSESNFYILAIPLEIYSQLDIEQPFEE